MPPSSGVFCQLLSFVAPVKLTLFQIARDSLLCVCAFSLTELSGQLAAMIQNLLQLQSLQFT